MPKHHTTATKMKMRESALRRLEEKPWTKPPGFIRYGVVPGNYKGERASYTAHHHWVKHHLDKLGICENCGLETKTEYANMSGDYLRDTSDWCELCVRCHRLIDDVVNKSWTTRKSRTV